MEGCGALIARWDVSVVTRWLEHCGLHQYKTPFAEARIDGLVLCTLSPRELVQLGTAALNSTEYSTVVHDPLAMTPEQVFQDMCGCLSNEQQYYILAQEGETSERGEMSFSHSEQKCSLAVLFNCQQSTR